MYKHVAACVFLNFLIIEKCSHEKQPNCYTSCTTVPVFIFFGGGRERGGCCTPKVLPTSVRASQGPFATRSNEHIQKFSQVHVATMTRRLCPPPVATPHPSLGRLQCKSKSVDVCGCLSGPLSLSLPLSV